MDALDDNDIIRLLDSSPALPESDSRLIKISEDTVVKLCHSLSGATSEALAMDLVRAQTTIPVPRIQRVIPHTHDEGHALIVMDFVKNARQLHMCWPSLSSLEKEQVVLTIKDYVQQLRRIQHPHSHIPGPVGPSPAPCNGLMFGYDPRGPFPTPRALADHFNLQLGIAQAHAARGYGRPPHCEPLDESDFTPLVFTHNDLNMRNILLDNGGQVWIVDWGFSGYFPPWFEHLSMRWAAKKDHEDSLWQEAIKRMAEPNYEMEGWLARLGYEDFP